MVTRDDLERRLSELRSEFDSGRRLEADLQTRLSDVQQTMLRVRAHKIATEFTPLEVKVTGPDQQVWYGGSFNEPNYEIPTFNNLDRMVNDVVA